MNIEVIAKRCLFIFVDDSRSFYRKSSCYNVSELGSFVLSCDYFWLGPLVYLGRL